MTRAIAIETSGRAGAIALVADGEVVGRDVFAHGLKHAAEMVPRIDALLGEQGWPPRALDEIYVSIGPGSFTGLRIGITFAKTLAMTTGAKLVGVPSVRVLAENAPPEARSLLIVLDARREQIFAARFEREAGVWIEREGAHLDFLRDALARCGRPVHLLGEGLSVHAKEVPRASDIAIAPESAWVPQAEAVAQLGGVLARGGHFTPPDLLLPLYVRKAEAEEKWEQDQLGGSRGG